MVELIYAIEFAPRTKEQLAIIPKGIRKQILIVLKN